MVNYMIVYTEGEFLFLFVYNNIVILLLVREEKYSKTFIKQNKFEMCLFCVSLQQHCD